MTTYNYSKESGKEIKAKLMQLLPIIAIAVIGPLALTYAVQPQLFPILLGIYLIVVTFAIFLAISLNKRTQIIMDNNQVSLKRPGKPNVTILRSEIKKIVQRSNNGIIVISQNSDDEIFVPSSLDGYDSIRNELNTWHRIESESPPGKRQLIIMISVMAISSIAAIGAFVFRIKLFFYVFALSFIIIIVYGLIGSFKQSFKKQSNTQSSNVIRRVLLILVIAYFVYKIIISFL